MEKEIAKTDKMLIQQSHTLNEPCEKGLELTCSQTNIKREVITTIIKGSNKNFRAVLKTNDDKQIKIMQQYVWGYILHCANVYTGAQFPSDKITKDHADIIDACQELVFSQFPMLSKDEIKLAFEMASAGRFDINMETYYGKFSVQFLGKILKAYLTYRTNVISKYNESLQLIESRKEDDLKEEKNQKARELVIEEYLKMKETYQNELDIDESKIQSFWGKILVDSNLITFTMEEKAEIYNEAKALVKEQMQKDLLDESKLSQSERISLRMLLKKVNETENTNDIPEDYKSKCIAAYSKLIVKKSIINT